MAADGHHGAVLDAGEGAGGKAGAVDDEVGGAAAVVVEGAGGDVGEDGALEVHACAEAEGDEVGEVDGGVDADGGEGRGVVVAF